MVALPLLDRAAELRQHHHRDIHFLGQQLEAARERADLLVAVLETAAAAHELQVIDNHQPDPARLGLQPPQLGMHIHQVNAGSVVDIQRRFDQLVQSVAELATLVRRKVPLAELLAIDPGRRAQHTREQRFPRHFERKNRHRLLELQRHVLGDVQCKSRLPHRRPRRHNEQIARMQPARVLIELQKAGADALDALRRVEKRVDPAVVALQDIRGVDQPALDARFSQLEQGLFGARQDFVWLLLAEQSPVHHVLRRENDPSQDGLVLYGADVCVQVGDVRQAIIE